MEFMKPDAFKDNARKAIADENLQAAMREAEVPFAAQNRLLAKLAPMSDDVVER